MMLKKLKLLGYLSLMGTKSTSVESKPTKKPTDRITPSNRTTAKNIDKDLLQKISFNGKNISRHISTILTKIANMEIYFIKISLEEILGQMINMIKKDMRQKDPTTTEEVIATTVNMIEQTKNDMLKSMEANRASEITKLSEKYKGLLNTSVLFAAVISLLLLLQSLQEADKKLTDKFAKLKDEYTHKLHNNSLYELKLFSEIAYYMLTYQQQLGKEPGTETENEALGKKILELTNQFATHRLESLKGASGFLRDLKKLLIEHYGAKNIGSAESNYCVIDGQTYSVNQLIDYILQEINRLQEKIAENLNNSNLNVEADIEVLFMIMTGYIIGDRNRDLE